MNEEKRKKQQEQFAQTERRIQRRNEVLAEYPEIAKFVKRKEKCIRLLLLIGLVFYILRIMVIGSMLDSSIGVKFFSFFMGYGMYWILLMACMSPNVKAQNCSVILCVGILFNTVSKNIKAISASGNLFKVYQEAFQVNPWIVISDVGMLVFFLLVCIVVIWVVFIPKNRRISKQYEELISI